MQGLRLKAARRRTKEGAKGPKVQQKVHIYNKGNHYLVATNGTKPSTDICKIRLLKGFQFADSELCVYVRPNSDTVPRGLTVKAQLYRLF